eukprot:TRINITY_DN2953_c0_g1_i1.p1 TRINITY_DN2953_c0_g1~~TRINITY_DN2953_c0_g1_i1.p1  ORF type:complete len:896 (+),score=256.31 TRINITY_DN2953_c0_g1_i1:38-2689(+)
MGGKDGGKGKGGGKGGKGGGKKGGYGGGGGGKGGPPTKVSLRDPAPLAAKPKEYIPPYNFTEAAPRVTRGKQTPEEVKSIKDSLAKMLNDIPKPQPGAAAKTKEVVSNVIELTFDKAHSIYYQYDVQLTPKISSRHKFKETVRQIIIDTHGKDHDIVVSGDIVYLNNKIKDQTYNWKHNGDSFYKKIAGSSPFKMDMKLTRSISNTEITAESRTVISNIVKEALDKNPDFQKIGRTMFHFKSAISLPELKKQVVPGLHITLVPVSVGSGFALQLDVTNKVVSEQTAFDELRLGDKKNINKGLSALVEDLVMMTVYDNKDKKKRTVHIDGADIAMNEETKLKDLDGRSLKEYFEQTYGSQVKIPKGQPLLYSKTQRRNKETGAKEEFKEYYLPSVLRITGIAPKINGPNLKAKMNELCAVKPNIRFKKILDLARIFFQEFKPLGEKWGLKAEPGFVKVPIMTAPSPTIVMSDGYEKSGESWRLDIDKRESNPRPTTGCFENSHPMKVVCAAVPSSCMGCWSDIQRIISRALDHFHKNKVTIKLEKIPQFDTKSVAEVCTKVGNKADCYFFLTDRTDDGAYNALKKYCTKNGVPSQVARVGSLSGSKTKSVLNNIAAQMLVKRGNALWAKKGCDRKGVMCVGISQSHAGDGAGRGTDSSVMGICSTTDSKMTHHHMGRVVLEPGATIAQGLEKPLKEALAVYEKKNKTAPRELVFFREGGSEGEVPLILLEEIAVIEKALEALKVNAKISFFLVIRNSHLRISTHDEGSIAATGVPGCGTVITSTVTSPVGMEFYLLSQVANIGSPCAVKYKCLRCDDEKDLKELKYPGLANDLASLYYNWQGPIATPSVCKYASSDAKLTSEALVEKGTICKLPADTKAILPFL